MKVNISIELTPSLIETLSPDQLKDIIYQFLAIEAESKVKNKVNISANAEGALNALESAKSVINEIITEKGDNTLVEVIPITRIEEKEIANAIVEEKLKEFKKFKESLPAPLPAFDLSFNNRANWTGSTQIIGAAIEKLRKVQKPKEFIKNSNGENIPMSKVVDLYKNGVSLAKICRKYDIKSTTLFSRLDRLGLTVKKKS